MNEGEEASKNATASKEAIFDIDDDGGRRSFEAFGQTDWMNASGGSNTMESTFPTFSPAELDEAAAAARNLQAADADGHGGEEVTMSGSSETNNESSEHRRPRSRRSAAGTKEKPKRRSSLKGAAAI